MDALDYSRQGLEFEIHSETQNDPELEIADGCDPSKKALDQTKVFHNNFDIDWNDQTKQWPEPEIGTENHYEPESEIMKGGETSQINQMTVLELNCFLQERVVLMTKWWTNSITI